MGLFDLFENYDINKGVKEYSSQENAVLLDVREPYEYTQAHIEGSVNLPLNEIGKISSVVSDKSLPVYVHCLSGARSGRAVSALKKMGYTQVKNIGGISSYTGKIMKGN